VKEVMAIIRLNMINRTKKALADTGIPSFMARECLGRGKGMVDFSVLRGAEKGYEEAISQLGQTQRLIPKRWITVVVPDKGVKKVVDAIIATNRTGKAGDGKIFVLPITEVLRVRTGESGDRALDEA
jgi:nitrogen regulatory protein PII 2